MKLKELTNYLDSVIPLSFQESYDNSGLQVGNPEKDVTSVLIALDVTGDVLDEAVNCGSDMIVTHHPLIFNGLKSITGMSDTGRIVINAIKNDIAIYSAHTNLDFIQNGVSWKMAERLRLRDIRVLSPLKNRLLKLVTFIPANYFKKVSDAVFSAGAGVTGNYDRCGFSVSGKGSFRAGKDAHPFIGGKGKVHVEDEIRFETILFSHMKEKIIRALIKAHPYEEVVYDLYKVENENTEVGSGCVGLFTGPLPENEFIKLISDVFEAKGLRHTKTTGRHIQKVAVCGGSGGSMLKDAILSGADAFITGDLKYHTYFEAENHILLIDTGHYESEKFSTEVLYDLINKKFPKFAVRFSKINTNPVNYL